MAVSGTTIYNKWVIITPNGSIDVNEGNADSGVVVGISPNVTQVGEGAVVLFKKAIYITFNGTYYAIVDESDIIFSYVAL